MGTAAATEEVEAAEARGDLIDIPFTFRPHALEKKRPFPDPCPRGAWTNALMDGGLSVIAGADSKTFSFPIRCPAVWPRIHSLLPNQAYEAVS